MVSNKLSSLMGVNILVTGVLGAIAPEMTLDNRYLARRALKKGLGTRYGDNCTEEDCWQDGACAFVDYTLPDGIDGSTCVSEEIWDSAANCGGCISVTYKGKTITVMVTNKTGGDANHLDMTPATWSKLTNGLTAGGVDGIEWDWVTCPIAQTEPLWIKMHGGASQYWVSATVENARRRTAKLEVSADEGQTWKETTRNTNNFFEMDGTLSTDTAWMRVTSHTGTQVVVKGVTLKSGVVTKAAANYA
ncbi:Barwin-related endoglucanase [Macrophomina phaseolina MS6]|uniref:Barwin-related endoglucanase n=2 Tax=Macrophomina phaseolina TaxID=35725 RepID=K2SBM1_MACPH|nr:Barwin-related endoglucanase [Macrophomina phaseolina MS6]KAH7039450.1 RlpA-like double-psi beta-barrel-protein domain-containing protein-containing protein [Macrophomina phaseolina]